MEDILASRPDLMLIDTDLHPEREELTGLQIAHSARSTAALRDVPIIVVTATPTELEQLPFDLVARGDVHRLSKPFDLTTFQRVVQTALGRAHGPTDAPGAGTILASPDQPDREEAQG